MNYEMSTFSKYGLRAGPITDNLFTQSFNESSTLPNIWAALTSVTENGK